MYGTGERAISNRAPSFWGVFIGLLLGPLELLFLSGEMGSEKAVRVSFHLSVLLVQECMVASSRAGGSGGGDLRRWNVGTMLHSAIVTLPWPLPDLSQAVRGSLTIIKAGAMMV